MGKPNSKLENPNANVINEVEIEQDRSPDQSTIQLYLLIITVCVCLNFFLKVYSLHNKRLKKKYTVNSNNSSDKI